MNLYSITSLLTCITSLFVGIFVYLRNKKGSINTAWALMSLSVGFWSFFTFLLFTSSNPIDGIVWSRALHIGSIFIPITFFNFVLALLDLKKQRKSILQFGYFISFLLLILNFTSLFVKSVSYKPLVRCFYPDPGPIYFLFILIYFIYPGYACLLLYKLSKIVKGYKRNQINYVLIASTIGFLGGATTFPLWYRIPVSPIGIHFVWLYALIITIAIVRYRLMDITVAITRTSVFVAVYTLVLGIPFIVAGLSQSYLHSILGARWWIAPLGLMALLATTGPFIYLYIQKRAENRLLGEQRRYQETLRQASTGMTRIRDLRKLLRLILNTVTQALKLNYAYIYLFDSKGNMYSLQEAMNENINRLDRENPLIIYLKDYRQPVVYEELKHQSEEGDKVFYALVESEMKKIKASVIIPNFVEDKLLGFIVLGDKISGQIFSEDDLVSLQFLGNQAALAIENALAYEELKTTKGKLLVAEKLASIGRLAAGIAHEIKNPLTSIKTFTEYLNEKFNESEFRNKFSRIVGGEVDRINHIVEGLLDFAQPKTPKTKLTDIPQIIEDVLILLENDVSKNKIEVKKDFISGLPPVLVDPEQIKQVLINLIINSLQAMENSPKRKLTIATSKINDYLSLKISDTGCGLSTEQITSIFEPFYSTRDKGVGLGLSIVHSIIKAHNGKIEVQSQPNQGTTFTVLLPINQS